MALLILARVLNMALRIKMIGWLMRLPKITKS